MTQVPLKKFIRTYKSVGLFSEAFVHVTQVAFCPKVTCTDLPSHVLQQFQGLSSLAVAEDKANELRLRLNQRG
jgi:hypothetical protein